MSNRALSFLIAAMLPMALCAKMPTREKANFNPKQFQVAKQLQQFGQSSSLMFIENKGQITDQHGNARKDIDFKLEGKGVNVFIGDGQLHYQFQRQEAESDKIEMYRLDVTLVGANKNAEPVTEDKQDYYENYYLAQCPDGAVAHSYKKITYKSVYPNIDWVLYAKGNELKYDFVVRQGGDVKNIQLRYDGVTSLEMHDGVVTAITPLGSLIEQPPYSYDAISKKTIPSSFTLRNNILAFNVATNCKELIIDPTLVWNTNFPILSRSLSTVKLDNAGNLYQGGWVVGSNNIATSGAHQTSYGGSVSDGYLAKYNNAGSIVWATYYGGSDTDEVISVTTDANNNVIIGGYTSSNSAIATSGSHQPTFGGGTYDCFIAKFSSSGTRIWSTYYGGSASDGCYPNFVTVNVVCDGSNIYLAGNTSSVSDIATSGSYPVNSMGFNGFIVKFSSSGIRQWGLYYAPITTIALDNTALYIGTLTLSNGGPVISKLNSSGSLVWNFTITNNGTPFIYAICPDRFGYLYVSGHNLGFSSLITKNKLVQTSNPNGLYKFSNTGNLIWGSKIYGAGTREIASDSFGNAFLTGYNINGIPPYPLATPCTYQSASQGQDGAFVAIYDSAGVNLWATDYLSQNEGWGIETDNANIYFGGDGNYGTASTVHSFLAKISLDTSVFIGHPYFDTLRCQGDTFKVTYGVLYSFKPGNNFTVQLSDASGSFAFPTNIGTTSSSSGGTITCVIPANAPFGTGYRIRILASNPNKISCDDGYNISIGTQIPAKPVASNDGPVCMKNSLHLYTSSSTSGVYYKWIGPNNYTSSQQNPTITNATILAGGSYIAQAFLLGCHSDDTTVVLIKPLPDKTDVSSNSPVCAGDTLKITNTDTSSGITYSWTGPNSFTSISKNPFIANVGSNGSGNYIVTATLNGCTFKDTAATTIYIIPVKPVINSNTPACAGDSLQLNSSSATPGVSYSWVGPNNFVSTAKDTGISHSILIQSGDYIVTATLNGCSSKDTEAVVIRPIPQNVTAGSNTPVCPGTTLSLSAGSSTSGVTWSWSGPSGFATTLQNPTRSNMQLSWAGTYTLTATLNGCPVSTNVNVQSYITTPTPTVGTNSPLCIGGTLNLTASNISGASYFWTGPGYSSNLQNPSRVNMQIAWGGVYSVTAHVNGCVSLPGYSQPVTLVSGPSVAAYASPSSTVCAGSNVALVAVPNNITGTPIYQWYLNSNTVAGAKSVSYIAPAPNNGDVFYVTILAGTSCNTPVASNNVSITTTPATPPPSATITASPGTDVWPGLNVTFSISNLTNGGSSPSYQWKKNGVNIAGAIAVTWNTTELKDGDSVCLYVTSSDLCATPKSTLSNCLVMKLPTGVVPLNPLPWDLRLYPNPVTKSLTIEGAVVGTAVQVNNIIGQVVYRGVIRSSKETINTSQWTSGGYIIYMMNKDGNRVARKVVKE